MLSIYANIYHCFVVYRKIGQNIGNHAKLIIFLYFFVKIGQYLSKFG